MNRSILLLVPLLLALTDSSAFAQRPPAGVETAQGGESRRWEISLFFGRFRAIAGGAHGRYQVRRLGDQILRFHEEPAPQGGLLGVRVDRRLSRWFAVEGSVAMAESPRDASVTRLTGVGPFLPPLRTGRVDLSAGSTCLLEGAARFTLHKFRSLELFVTPGIGLTARPGIGRVGLQGTPGFDLGSDYSGYLTAGPGAKVPLGRHWGLRGDVRTRWAERDLSPSAGVLYLDWTAGPYFEF